jgi:hypothetical protein
MHARTHSSFVDEWCEELFPLFNRPRAGCVDNESVNETRRRHVNSLLPRLFDSKLDQRVASGRWCAAAMLTVKCVHATCAVYAANDCK